jgi:hypothetical protein
MLEYIQKNRDRYRATEKEQQAKPMRHFRLLHPLQRRLSQQTIRGDLGCPPGLLSLHQQLSVFLSAAQWLCYVHLCT